MFQAGMKEKSERVMDDDSGEKETKKTISARLVESSRKFIPSMR